VIGHTTKRTTKTPDEESGDILVHYCAPLETMNFQMHHATLFKIEVSKDKNCVNESNKLYEKYNIALFCPNFTPQKLLCSRLTF
jgi:hypothetical protein